MIYQAIYSSKAIKSVSLGDIENILADARDSNNKSGITGILIYVDDVFIQILEGEKSEVMALIKKISQDSRHSDIKVFGEREIETRSFDGWAMANVDIDREHLLHWLGLEGTVSMHQIIEHVEHEPSKFPDYLERILKTVASKE